MPGADITSAFNHIDHKLLVLGKVSVLCNFLRSTCILTSNDIDICEYIVMNVFYEYILNYQKEGIL